MYVSVLLLCTQGQTNLPNTCVNVPENLMEIIDVPDIFLKWSNNLILMQSMKPAVTD